MTYFNGKKLAYIASISGVKLALDDKEYSIDEESPIIRGKKKVYLIIGTDITVNEQLCGLAQCL